MPGIASTKVFPKSQNTKKMENSQSQSSNIFSDDGNKDNNSILLEDPSGIPFDHAAYETMLVATKAAFGDYHNKINDILGFSTYFTKTVEDVWTCISISLEDQIKLLLAHKTVPIEKIADYLKTAVGLIKMMTQFYRTNIDLVPVNCSSMKTLPRMTGQIILSVFTHCRDSETLYGEHLERVASELKQLFRACHELQLVYITLLEVRFSFDVDEPEDRNVLIEALRINLKIGQVVQSLDVKTMAEQWKANTAICDKYAAGLSNTDVCAESIQVLCALLHDNIETTFEEHQDEKVITRSLKVASFTMKILLKTCHIYSQSSSKNYDRLVELLHYIWIMNVRCLETQENSLASQMNSYVMSPAEDIISGQLLHEEFVNSVFESHSSLINDEELMMDGDNLLGLLLLLTSAMKCTAQLNKRHNNDLKIKLVTCIYSLMPYSHVWLRRRLHFTAGQQGRCHGVFEEMLSNCTALALTMVNAEFNALEKCMVEAILGTDCVSALFSSHLWALLARHMNSSLLFIQLVWLCTMYKKLDKQKLFIGSPQDIHLSQTMNNLFKLIDDEDKLKICKQFRLHDEDNVSLWTALRIRNLPVDTQISAEDFVADKLKTIVRRLLDRGDEECFIQFIQIAKLAATCTFKNTRGIEDLVVLLWLKACQEKRVYIHGLGYHTATVWFYDYINALAALTDFAVRRVCEKSEHFIQVLHVICGLIRIGDSEIKLILTNILCKMATYANRNKILVDTHFSEAFTSSLDSEDIVRNRLFCTLREFRHIVKEYDSLHKSLWNVSNSTCDVSKGCDSKYIHKCFGSNKVRSPFQERDNTMDAVDDFRPTKEYEADSHSIRHAGTGLECKDSGLECFNSNGSGNQDEKPPCKRGKPTSSVTDRIISVLEENTTLITQLSGFTHHELHRIQKVCEQLKNISY